MAKKVVIAEVNKFTKEQILSAKKYRNSVDLISAILEDEKIYSFEEVDTLINKYMKGSVK